VDTSLDTVSKILTEHHHQLDGRLAEAKRTMVRGDFAAAREFFLDFACGLSTHIRIEERLLFPRIERARGTTEVPAKVMRAEHRGIEALLGEIVSQLANRFSAAASLVALEQLVLTHKLKEERMLYPLVDEIIADTLPAVTDEIRTLLRTSVAAGAP
jgi:iron-sulfur cluster repair protein YtfE (RIC family)